MAKLDREPKDPVRKGRAELVKAVTGEEWAARPGSKLEKQGRDGLKLVVAKAPDYILDAEGEVIGVDAWVQLFDERGRELPIDPHRRIINPPTVPRAGVRLVETGQAKDGRPAMERLISADPVAAFWEAVWDSVEGAPNPKGWRTRGTVTTVFASTADGYVYSRNSSYTTARSGSNLSAFPSSTSLLAGQSNNFEGTGQFACYESFVSFDTSAIADDDTVSAVTLDLYLRSSGIDTIEARALDWGASLTTADWVAGASLSGLTLLASSTFTQFDSTNTYRTFASQAAFLSAANLKTGTVYLLLSSGNMRTSGQPTSVAYVQFSAADETGTTQDPKLTITHLGAGGSPFFTHRPNRIWRLG
ncbi:hypothetical protein ABZW49_20145 [Nonomuraea wenchangensis]